MAKRILVVEDNDLNRKLFCDVLKANGYEVVPVSDGQNVLATAKRFGPDLADYLAKPVSIGPFMTAVRALLPD